MPGCRLEQEDSSPGPAKLKVFVSYSRKDAEAFADELAGGLEFHGGFDVSLDRHSIVEGEDWRKRLGALIADADTVVFIVSPGSAASEICRWEVDEAARLSKRIVPVLWIAPPQDGQQVPERLAELNYTRFDEGRSFISGLKALVAALNTDIGWVREHTRLLARALEWENAKRVENRMLTGSDIAAAKNWAACRPKGAPELTVHHLEFIRASEEAETARKDALARQQEERARLLKEAEIAAEERARALDRAEEALRVTTRLQRRQSIAAAAAFVILSLGGWWGYGLYKERIAVRVEREAVAREAARTDIRGQIVSYATARGKYAADKAEGYETSPYSTVVSRTLTQRRKSIMAALTDAHSEVARLSAFHQRPYLSSSMNGQIYLAEQPSSRNRKAILVSVDDPNIGKAGILSGPKHDVEAIRQSLLTLGFSQSQIVTLHNVDAEAIMRKIQEARRELAPAKSALPDQPHIIKTGFNRIPETKAEEPLQNTLLLFFFSGHGVEIGGQDYIVPRLPDGRSATPNDIAGSGILVSHLTRTIDDLAAASIVILDTHFPRLGGSTR
jgi:hypothetical protein